MSTAVNGRMSLAVQARLAGLSYLVVIAAGIFVALGVREALFVAGDAAATAESIAGSQQLWRAGIAIHLLYLLPGAVFSVILYRLFSPTHPTLALLALVLVISDVALEALLLTGLYVPLVLIEEGRALAALDDGHRQALGYLGVRLFLVGWNFALLLFAGFCALTGVLILRTRLLPRVIGMLMIAAGAGYFANSLAGVLAPGLAAALLPWVLLPPFVGELSLAAWLAFRGVRPSSTEAS